MPALTDLAGRVVLVDHDRDFADAVPDAERELARRASVAAVIELEGPRWDPVGIVNASSDDWLGLLLLEGLMIRRVQVGRRSACELFGPGDVVRPWDADGEYGPLPVSLHWTVLRRARLAVLDGRFAVSTARWPAIAAQVIKRVAERARHLALTQAITHLPRTHPRLLMLFWLLADRWGRVSADGVHISLPLTHETLSMLVGSHRPTVTLALQRLARAGLLIREGQERWLLTNRAIELLAHPESLAMIEDEPEPDENTDGDEELTRSARPRGD